MLDGHPNPAIGVPFFPAATGSLGQGLSIAAGLALAARLDQRPIRVHCLIGDGESREGQVWEGLDFLRDHDVRTVCPIFNVNGYGQTGPVSRQQSPRVLAARLEALGFEAVELDGHEPEQILDALSRHERSAAAEADTSPPVALVARTVKGWGMPSLASQPSGKHGQAASGEERDRALAELAATATEIGAWSRGEMLRPRGRHETRDGRERRHAALPRQHVRPGGRMAALALPTLDDVLEQQGAAVKAAEKGLSTRKAYGYALRELGRRRPDVVALDGDVSNSTYSELFADEPSLEARRRRD